TTQSRSTPQNTTGYRIQFITATRRNRSVPDIGCQNNASHTAEKAHQDKYLEGHSADIDTGKPRRISVSTDGIGIASKARVVGNVPHDLRPIGQQLDRGLWALILMVAVLINHNLQGSKAVINQFN